MTLAELSFAKTVAAAALNALFTAVLVGIAATVVVKYYENRSAENRQAAEARHKELLQEQQHDYQTQAQQQQLEYQTRAQEQQLEYQTRAALRETYAQFLVAQRRAREASRRLAKAKVSGGSAREDLQADAVSSHDGFIDLCHRLNLDASRGMWKDARGLRAVLDKMLEKAKCGNTEECEELAKIARTARQNLEGSVRLPRGAGGRRSSTTCTSA
jgi:hypothetical protein